jgi:hypothetical protein
MALLPIGAKGFDLLVIRLVAELIDFNLDVAAEHDVGSATGHVGGDGDGSGRPASATMLASRSCCLALSTWCSIFASLSIFDTSSETSIEAVPTSTGWPRLHAVADVFDDRRVLLFLGQIDEVVWSSRTIGWLVGITTTSRP